MDEDKEYISLKLPVQFYGENLDEELKKKPQFRSRAELVKEIIRKHYLDNE